MVFACFDLRLHYSSGLFKIWQPSNMSWVDIIVWALLWFGFVGIFVFLFFNHLPHARRTEVVMTRSTFQIIQNGEEYSCGRDEITEVIERSTYRIPWSHVIKWTIKTKDREFVISSLIISRLTFESYFWNKTRHVTAFFTLV